MSDGNKSPYRGMTPESAQSLEDWVQRMAAKRRARGKWTRAELVALGTDALTEMLNQTGSPRATSYALGVALGLLLCSAHDESRREALGFMHAGYMKGMQITAQAEANQDAAAGMTILNTALGPIAGAPPSQETDGTPEDDERNGLSPDKSAPNNPSLEG